MTTSFSIFTSLHTHNRHIIVSLGKVSLLLFLLLIPLYFMACQNTSNPESSGDIVNTQEPIITTQPQGATYDINEQAVPLSVTAVSPDGGKLSYQWYSGTFIYGLGLEWEWTAINGATGASYTPPTTTVGAAYYSVRVTNTNDNVNGTRTAVTNSDRAMVMITRIYYSSDDEFEALLDDLSGVWYSHYAGIGRLDGYRIGAWKDFDKLATNVGKESLVPNMVKPAVTYTGYTPKPDDYFVLYDSSVYGQKDDNSSANQEWEGNFGFCGIVRVVNLFYDMQDRGAIIIEYLKGCAPQWDDDIKNGQLPFYGIYYRILTPDIVQIANAVDLAALYRGEKYYTEKETIQEAIDSNTVENEAEYIAWGVVIPQDREK
jgi:hypothetical protein